QITVRSCCLVPCELNQVATIQEIFEQRLFVFGKLRRTSESIEKLHRSLPGDWQPELLRHVAPENVGHANAEAIWIHRRNLGPYLLQQCECALTRRLEWCWAPERLRKKPHDQADYRE